MVAALTAPPPILIELKRFFMQETIMQKQERFIEHPLIKPRKVEERIYQQVLAASVLDKGNSLVVANTALGKTIVAALIAAHQLVKQPEKKVLFLSPTKPLAVQHQNSFREIMNLNEAVIELFTGQTKQADREKLWSESKIISSTPQVIENLLVQGKIDLSNVSLCIFDESHRAVGDYSYVFVAQKFRQQNPAGLVVGLTASPGATEEKIHEVCKNLFIDNIEVKTINDADVKPYVNEIDLTWIRVDLPAEFLEVKKDLNEFIKEQLLFIKKIGYAKNIYLNRLRQSDLLLLQSQLRKDMVAFGKEKPVLYQAVSRIAALLKASHAVTLLETQGTQALNEYFNKMLSKSGKSGAPRALKLVLSDERVLNAIKNARKLAENGVNHPKIPALKKVLEKQFASSPESRAIVFNHYRDSVKTLVGYLNQCKGVKAKKFIGQADKEKDKGMSQKEQIQSIKDFKEGTYNVLVASSVAEEGLDIPACDLVVFFEPVPSEIRHIQRLGRTARKSKGKAVILMAKNTRDEAFYWVAKRKEQMMHDTLDELRHEKAIEGNLKEQLTLDTFNPEKPDEVIIFADHREQAGRTIKELSNYCNVRMQQLEIGDFVLSKDVVVERKTVQDFLASIIDGRLFPQLVSLSAYKSPLIILEGNTEELFSRAIHEHAIIGALTTIATKYRIPIFVTKDPSETAKYLHVIAKREQIGEEKDIRLRNGSKGLSLNEQQQFIIESLPLIGPTTAKKLLKHFGSVQKIFSASEKELMEAENIGPKRAAELRRVIEGKYTEE